MASELKNIIEALLMAADGPLSVAKIQGAFEDTSAPEADEVKEVIVELQADCEGRAIELKKIGSGYRYQTRIKYADWIRKLQAGRPPRLSRALLETLSIIAYRQPVSRGDIEEIRGVAVSPEIMQRLIERGWVKQVGVRDTPGRPALFGTTPVFLAYFNLESLSELPPLMDQRELGDIARELETPLPPEVLAALDARQEGNENQVDVFELSLEVSQQEPSDDNDNSEESDFPNQSSGNQDETSEEVLVEDLETELSVDNETDSEIVDREIMEPDVET